MWAKPGRLDDRGNKGFDEWADGKRDVTELAVKVMKESRVLGGGSVVLELLCEG